MYYIVLPLIAPAVIGVVFLLYYTHCIKRSIRRGDIVPNMLSDVQYAVCVCAESGDTLTNVAFADGHKYMRVVSRFMTVALVSIICGIILLHWTGANTLKQQNSNLTEAIERIREMEE